MAECGYLRSMKQSVIREIRSEEIPLLNDFLYEAIFIPEGVLAPPRSIIENEDLQVYVRDFGKKANYAFRMYQKAGFEVMKETEEEYLMLCELKIVSKHWTSSRFP